MKRVLTILIIAAGLVLALRIAPYQVDDSFIFFRYADNIASGFGPVFNHGGPNVEGFTSPLWLALLTVVAKLFGANAIPGAATMLGALAFLSCVLLLSRFASSVTGFLGVAAWAVSPGAIFYACTGMETPLFAALVLCVHAAIADAIPIPLGMMTALFATWARPEWAWLPVAGLAQLIATKAPPKRAIRLLIPLLIGAALLLATRWMLFRQLVPNTYFAKQPSLSDGLHYFGLLLQAQWAVAIMFLGIAGGIAGGAQQRGMLVAAIAWLAPAILEGGDWMGEARLFQPALILFAAASTGIAKLPVWAAIPLPLIALSAQLPETLGATRTIQNTLRSTRSDARALIEWTQIAGAQSIALVDIGEIGFALPDVEVTDLSGLTDPRVAHSPGAHLSKRYDPEYVLAERHPAVIVLRLVRMPTRDAAGKLAPIPTDTGSDVEAILLIDPRLQREYQLLFVQAPSPHQQPFHGRAVYVRRDVQLPPNAAPPSDVVYVQPPPR